MLSKALQNTSKHKVPSGTLAQTLEMQNHALQKRKPQSHCICLHLATSHTFTPPFKVGLVRSEPVVTGVEAAASVLSAFQHSLETIFALKATESLPSAAQAVGLVLPAMGTERLEAKVVFPQLVNLSN